VVVYQTLAEVTAVDNIVLENIAMEVVVLEGIALDGIAPGNTVAADTGWLVPVVSLPSYCSRVETELVNTRTTHRCSKFRCSVAQMLRSERSKEHRYGTWQRMQEVRAP
jgi:hypothetical protein